MNKQNTINLTIIATAICALSGCVSSRIDAGTEAVEANTKPALNKLRDTGIPITENTRGTAAYSDRVSQQIKTEPVAKRSTKPWIGSRLVNVQNDSVLPPIFNEPIELNFDNRSKGGRVSIAVVAERISRLSGVSVRVKADVYGDPKSQTQTVRPAPQNFASTNRGPIPAPLPSPVGKTNTPPGSSQVAGLPFGADSVPSPVIEYTQPITDVNAVEMKWKGSLTGFLDHVTGLLNLSWSYRDGVVVIEKYVTDTFEVAAFGGTQDFKMSMSGTSSGAGTFGAANAAMDVNESGKLAALDSLKSSITSMLVGTGGSVVLNEASGRFTVTAPKDVLSRIRDVVRSETEALQRQAHIQFDIYSWTTKDSEEYGFDYSGVINTLAKTVGATINSPASLVSKSAAGLTYTLLKEIPEGSTATQISKAAQFGGSSALLQALSQNGNTVQYRPVSMVALTRQWARKTSLKTTGYVAETTPSTSSSAGSGAPGLKTSTVTTGDKFLVQPAILDNGSILLKMGASMTNLIGLYNVSAGSGSSLQTVQTPETSGTDDQLTLRLNPGEAMVITGLSRRTGTNDRSGLSEHVPIVLGGSKKSGYAREDFMIVVRVNPL